MAAAGTNDLVWEGRDVDPGTIEAQLRRLLEQAHRSNEAYVPARVLNLVCVVDKAYEGEIANRLRRVGRYHPSRTIVCAVEPGRRDLDAVASVATPAEAGSGTIAIARELVVVDCGERHVPNLDRVVDALVVTDLPTVVWAPHGHAAAVDALRGASQVVLLDSVDEPDPGEALRRAEGIRDGRYVVDLAWLRSTPWRERLAATFDPAPLRPDLRLVSRFVVRHHPDSAAAAALLAGWMASRLGWDAGRLTTGADGTRRGRAHARKQDVDVVLEPDASLAVRGLAGIELESASGRWMRLDRGPGGLRARYRRAGKRPGAAPEVEREWTVLGASRGEAGILGEGIRQALLRDPTYGPALAAASRMLA